MQYKTKQSYSVKMFKLNSHAGGVQAHGSYALPRSLVAHLVIHRRTKTNIQHERKNKRDRETKREGETGRDSVCSLKNYTIIQLFEIAVHSSVQALWVELFAEQMLLIKQKKKREKTQNLLLKHDGTACPSCML